MLPRSLRPVVRVFHALCAALCGIALASELAGAQPNIQVTPSSYTENVAAGDSLLRTLTIANTGSDSLHYSISFLTGLDSLSRPMFRPAPFTFAAPGAPRGPGSRSVPRGYRIPPPSRASGPVHHGSGVARVLLVQDAYPWGSNAVEQVLTNNGISYDVIGSSQLATTALSNYGLLIVPSDQPQYLYDALVTRASQIESFVLNGGTLEFHAAASGGNGGNSAVVTLPGGMAIFASFWNENPIELPGHPIVLGVPNPITGTSASHASFANVPAGAQIIARDGASAPNLVEYRHGNGTVIAGGQTFEYGYLNGQAPGQILANMIPYAYALSNSWLRISTRSGTIAAGGQDDLTLVIDATRLMGGTYAQRIAIDSDDSGQSRVIVPVDLTVTGIPNIVAYPTSIDFGPVLIGARDSVLVRILNFGTDQLTGTTGLSGADPGFSSDSVHFTLAPGESTSAVVRFAPTQLGPVSTTLTIASNDPDQPTLLGTFSGTGIPAPDIGVSPESLLVGLAAGDSLERTVTITNSGGSDLMFDVSVRGVLAPPGPGQRARARITRIASSQTAAPAGDAGRSEDERAGQSPHSAKVPVWPPGSDRTLAGTPPHIDASFHFFDGFEDGDYAGWQVVGGSLIEVTDSTAANGLRSLHQVGNGNPFSGLAKNFNSEHPTDIGFYVRCATNTQYSAYVVLTDSLGGIPIYFAAGASGTFLINESVGGHSTYPYQPNAWYHVEFRNIDYQASRFDYVVNGVVIKPQVPFNFSPYMANVARVDLFSYDYGTSAWWDDVELSAAGTASWLTAAPTTGVIPAGGSADLTVSLNAADLLGGGYDGEIAVTSNDPDERELAVPVHLQVTGIPDVRLDGPERHVTSTQSYVANGAITNHSLVVPTPYVGGAELELKVLGDYGYYTETATLVVEGDSVGTSLPTINDCLGQTSTFAIPPATFATWASDGVLNAQVVNTFDVDVFCTTNTHTVTLRVRAPADTVRLAPVFLGDCASETLRVVNAGTDVLHITGVGMDNAAFGVSGGPIDLAPGASAPIAIHFCPAVLGPDSSTLTITSDDPDAGTLTAVIQGTALDPPIIGVTPDSLTVALLSGETTTLPLTISNTGASDLTFSVDVALADAPQSRPATGKISQAPSLNTRWGAPALPPAGRRIADPPAGRATPGARLFAGLPLVLTDPAGDASAPDLVEVRGVSSRDSLEVELVLAAAVNPNNFGGAFSIDVDQNPATGVIPSYSLGGQDARVEYEVFLFGLGSGVVDLYGINTGYIGSFPARINGASLRFTLPLAALGNDDGNVDFSGVIGTGGGPTDWFPDVGHGTIQTLRWLTLTPEQGTVIPGGSQVVDAHFDAAGLLGGDYRANVVVNSNAPLARVVTIPAHLHVTGVPDIRVSPVEIAFGGQYIGLTRSRSIRIQNVGTDQIEATTSLVIDGGGNEFIAPQGPLSLAPGDSVTFAVLFTPVAAVASTATFTVNSNDPDQPVIDVALTGEGLVPPEIAVTPDSILAGLNTGDIHTRTLHIDNTGGTDLNYLIRVEGLGSPVPASARTPKVSVATHAVGMAAPSASPAEPAAWRPAGMTGSIRPRPDFVDPTRWLETPARPESHSDAAARQAAQRAAHAGPSLADSIVGFFDGFEDGDANGWINTGQSLVQVTNETAARGNYSVRITSPGAGGHFTGLARVFGPSQPTSVSFDVRLPDTSHNSGYVVLMDAQGFDVIWFFAQANGKFYVNDPVFGDATFNYSPNTWYHIEFRNIDFTGKTFDYYVDGVLIKIAANMRNSLYAQSLGTVYLYNWDPLADAWWDDVAIGADESVDWLRTDPISGVVPAGGSADVTVTLDATDLIGGPYDAALRIISNDVDEGEVVVPVHLDVTGVPNLAVALKAGDFTSSQTFSSYSATTFHDFGLPGGGHALGARLDLTLSGDFADPGETALLTVEGSTVGVAGPTPYDCGSQTFSYPVTPAVFDGWASDGVVHAWVQNSVYVDPQCVDNRHTLRLRYYDVADTVRFGPLFIGACRGESLRVSNTGSEVLHITGLSVTSGPFSVYDSVGVALAPGEAREINVQFCPTAVGLATGELTLLSDDPDHPVFTVQLTGVGVTPPILNVSPASLSASLLTGGTDDQLLRIENTGGSELSVNLQVLPGGSPPDSTAERVSFGSGVRSAAGLARASADEMRSGSMVPGESHEAAGARPRVAAEPILPVVLTDAAGDGGAVDVIAIRASGQGDSLRMQLDFTGNVDFANFNGVVSFDMDQNPFTGTPAGTGVGTHDGGIEYEVLFYDISGYRRVELYSTGPYIYRGAWPAVADGARLRFSIPLSALGGDDGRINFVGAVGTIYGITDWFPESGHGTIAQLNWLSLGASDLTLQPGAFYDVNVHFDATGLFGGDYAAAIHAQSNDPVRQQLDVPVALHVTGAADIAVRPDSVVFPDVPLGSAFGTPVWISNRGTALLTGDCVASTLGGGLEFGPTVPVHFVLAPFESVSVEVTFAPTVSGTYAGTLTVSSDDADEALLLIPLQGNGYTGPHMVLTPDQVHETVMIGSAKTVPIEIANTGDRPLYWAASTTTAVPVTVDATVEPIASLSGAMPKSAAPVLQSGAPPGPMVTLAARSTAKVPLSRSGPSARLLPASAGRPRSLAVTLEDLRVRLDSKAAFIAEAIPSRFNFSEGETGSYIVDGGADMYDTGNMLGTNRGSPINYSNDGVSSSAMLGPQGRYTTRKYPGLWVFAADLDSVDTVNVFGDLGADGGGFVDGSVLSMTMNGRGFTGFVKRVYGAGDPSVNHLFIVEDAPGLTQSFSANTNQDFHQIEGLGASRRLYLLVYARTNPGYIDNAATFEIMRRFLEAAEPPWLTVSPDSGVVAPGSSSTMNVTLNAIGLELGDHEGALHVLSNDPIQSDFTLNVTLHADTTTAVAWSLVDAHADPSAAHLAWHIGGGEPVSATVYRREGTGGWDALGVIASDGDGFLRFDDPRVVAGHRYGYRLGFAGDVEEFSDEVLVDVPATLAFALHGPQPNPSTSELKVSFTLSDQRPATLEVMDLAGRRVATRDVGALGVGRHTIALGEGRPIPAGVYMIRLTRGESTLTRKAVVMQ